VSALFGPRSFRVGMHLVVVVGVAALFFGGLLFTGRGALGGAAAWGLLGVFASLAWVLSTLRLDIGRDAFTTRSAFGATTMRYDAVERAYFEVVRTSRTPQGVAAFFVEPRHGAPVKVNLRVFPVAAAALLLRALETRDIPIDVPDAWAARRMYDQIKAAQGEALRRR
jgi:hypothetical protein